jgi:hypothetical protein
MRWTFAFGLVIALCWTAASAAPVHRSKPPARWSARPHLNVPPRQVDPPGRFAVPGWSDDATRRWMDNASAGWTKA